MKSSIFKNIPSSVRQILFCVMAICVWVMLAPTTATAASTGYACVALTSSTSGCTIPETETPPDYSKTWSITCDGTTVRGIATVAWNGSVDSTNCQSGHLGIQKTLYYPTTGSPCATCYCRAFSPSVWPWWAAVTNLTPSTNANSLSKKCAYNCAAWYGKIIAQTSSLLTQSRIN